MPNPNARALRRQSTDTERHLWRLLRARRLAGHKFRRQHPIGPFIADFACTAARLVIETDGGQHADAPSDAGRTAWLEARGWRVLRFWNPDVLTNPEHVTNTILAALGCEEPSPGFADLSRKRGRGEGRRAGEGTARTPPGFAGAVRRPVTSPALAGEVAAPKARG